MQFQDSPSVFVGAKTTFGVRTNSLDEFLSALKKARELVSSWQDPTHGLETRLEFVQDVQIAILLKRSLVITVEPDGNEEYIVLDCGGRRRRVSYPRNDLHVFASCDLNWKGPRPAELRVSLFPDQPYGSHNYVCEGICLVRAGNPASGHIVLNDWLDPGITPEALVGFVSLAETRANEVIEKILSQPIL